MPAFVLGNAIAAVLMRHTRSAMLQVLSSDYVRTARAKGLSERGVILKHALRNALIPVITLGALELGTLLSGAVLTEQVFTIPGFRQADRRRGVQPRLRGRARGRAVHGDGLHPAQPARGHRLRDRQSADQGALGPMAPREDALPAPVDTPRVSPRSHAFRRLLRRRGAALGVVVIVIVVTVAVLAPVVAPVRSARDELERDPQGAVRGPLVRHG
jgi:hypothetical protein